MSEWIHRPVLLEECVEALNIRPDGVYLDGTLGRGGHSEQIVKRLASGRLICVDRDQAALDAARERLAPWVDRVTLIHSNFDRVDEILDELSLPGVDGMLFDLGVSSPQLDDGTRGFSYMADAPLDMRMSQQGASAYDLVNSWDVSAMARVLREFGEEKYALPIAKKICRAREEKPVETTGELVELIKAAIPPSARYEGGHPAKRSFQAIRIAVNSELDSLSRCLDTAFARLAPGGRFAVITFHSLEDRMVKQKFAAYCKGCICPPDFPVCVCGHAPEGKLVNKKPIEPSPEEQRENSRSRSATLRVLEKL